jgi:hypothetical protein
MTVDEIKLYARQERIKAYIYFGVEAELELIANRVERAFLDPDNEKNLDEISWYDKHVKIFEAKIKRANERIEDLTVLVATEHEK